MIISVKAARVNANLSQREVAEHLGMGLKTYVQKENGKTRFYADEIVQLSRLLNIQVQNFLETTCRIKTQA